MAEYNTMRAAAGTRSAAIDAGLRAHMNKVYGTMSVGMLITFAAAWALSGLAVTDVPNAYQIGTDKFLTGLGVESGLDFMHDGLALFAGLLHTFVVAMDVPYAQF